MLKRTLFVMILAIQFIAIAGQGFAHIPDPDCFPCPESSQR